MKKILLTVAVLGGMFANAQDFAAKGSKFVSGNLGFTQTKNTVEGKKVKKESIDLRPQAGYFIMDNLAVGVGLGYQYNKYTSKGSSTHKSDLFSVDPFVRKYFSKGAFRPFAQIEGSFGWGKNKNTIYLADDKSLTESGKTESVWGVNLIPGFSYALSRSVTLDAAFGRMGYNKGALTPNKDTGHIGIDTKSNNYDFDLNLEQLRLGLSFYF